MSACTRCGGTGRTKWCDPHGNIKGPCPKCQPREAVLAAVEKHRRIVWGKFPRAFVQFQTPFLRGDHNAHSPIRRAL